MRPVILGMATSRPNRVPLSPHEGAGRRMFEMSGMAIDVYLSSFEFRNLCPYPWKSWVASDLGWAVRQSLEGRRVLVLGRGVWHAMRLPGDAKWFSNEDGFTLLPHPSGRNLMLNDPSRIKRMGEIIRKAARQ